MRVILDACVPHKLRLHLPGHEVDTAHFVGLDRLDDAPLLNAIDGTYDALVTCDQGFEWQQRLSGRKTALVVLVARSNDIGDLLPLMPEVQTVLKAIRPGEVVKVGA